MSYFFACVNSRDSEIHRLEKIFSDLIPQAKKVTVSSHSSCVTKYSQAKVIEDIVIKHKKSKSWMALIGMPLIEGETDDELQALMESFLDDHQTTISRQIDGHFALLAYDSSRDTFIAATDSNCFVPIFYAATPSGTFFSSSELALAKLLQPEIDPAGFSEAIHLGVTWNSKTRFKNIAKMCPCEIITIDAQNALNKERYWEPTNERLWNGDFDKILERWLSILRDCVLTFYEKSTVKDPVWLDFTGGEDSRLLVAQCQALGIPYRTRVGGSEADIKVASQAAKEANFDLVVQPYCSTTEDQLVPYAREICLRTDGYGSFFHACIRFATDAKRNPLVFDYLHFSGVPGGEAFRGKYYLRAKILFPSVARSFDSRFFTRLKYLLDHTPHLMNYSDKDFLDQVHSSMENSLRKVAEFPAGIKVDHLLREFQTCCWGLTIRKPFYLPLGLKHTTRSIYCLPPHFKSGGKLTKAATEILFPRLANTKTLSHVPTIRKSFRRLPAFLPGYFFELKKVFEGATNRLARFNQSSRSLSNHHRLDINAPAMETMLNQKPYSEWFISASSMFTGELYNRNLLDPLLHKAKNGKCNRIEVLGRIINQEIACRYVFDVKD